MDYEVTQKKNFVESICDESITIYKDWQGLPGQWLLVSRDKPQLINALWRLWEENITPYPPEGDYEYVLIRYFPFYGFWRSIIRFSDFYENLPDDIDDEAA